MKINRENGCKFFIYLVIVLIFIIMYVFWFKKVADSDSMLEVILIGITSTPMSISWWLFCKNLAETGMQNEDEHQTKKKDEKNKNR